MNPATEYDVMVVGAESLLNNLDYRKEILWL